MHSVYFTCRNHLLRITNKHIFNLTAMVHCQSKCHASSNVHIMPGMCYPLTYIHVYTLVWQLFRFGQRIWNTSMFPTAYTVAIPSYLCLSVCVCYNYMKLHFNCSMVACMESVVTKCQHSLILEPPCCFISLYNRMMMAFGASSDRVYYIITYSST